MYATRRVPKYEYATRIANVAKTERYPSECIQHVLGAAGIGNRGDESIIDHYCDDASEREESSEVGVYEVALRPDAGAMREATTVDEEKDGRFGRQGWQRSGGRRRSIHVELPVIGTE